MADTYTWFESCESKLADPETSVAGRDYLDASWGGAVTKCSEHEASGGPRRRQRAEIPLVQPPQTAPTSLASIFGAC
ncbi:unnamed protein product [Caenorhabditis auriculariae]|uniref:Uncharacterized protein n=1 Tax=Caenorhabditis auriculariae TaxID=2777116 RepID=A0A8S1H1R7_9PELO|nr:unnamed protein product [Caenorhabditis auriculariae]